MRLANELRRTGRIAGFATVTAGMVTALLAHEALHPGEGRSPLRDWWVGAWCSVTLELFGLRVMVTGSAPWPQRGRLVVANHRSTADILVLLRHFQGQLVSRSDLARWPFVGAAAKALDTVFVDRTSATSRALALRTIRERLDRGATVVLFPEGTTFPDDEVRPFHGGAFVAASQSGAEILPVGLAYGKGSGAAFVNESFRDHLARMARARPSRLAMCIGAPILAQDARGAEHSRNVARAEVQRLVSDARRIVDAA